MGEAIEITAVDYKQTPADLRNEAQFHEDAASDLYGTAMCFEEELHSRGEEWKPGETRRYLSIMLKAVMERQAAILCRLVALEMERGAGP